VIADNPSYPSTYKLSAYEGQKPGRR
jgi:hypothetical protein